MFDELVACFKGVDDNRWFWSLKDILTGEGPPTETPLLGGSSTRVVVKVAGGEFLRGGWELTL